MAETTIYQLKVSLQDVRPSVWRRLLVPAYYSLELFHDVIQTSMGWENAHLYSFEYGGCSFEEGTTDTLDSLNWQVNDKLLYIYDFGDNWGHLIKVEKQLKKDQKQPYPYCVTGKNNCPPEDCGGAWGYKHLLSALKNKNHPEHEEMSEWMDEDFDPTYFSEEEVNRQLKSQHRLLE